MNILVAERFNVDEDRDTHYKWMRLLHENTDRYLQVMFRLGAFRKGNGRARLESIGVPKLNITMNLLPPSVNCGEWDEHDAHLAADVLREWVRWNGVEQEVTYWLVGRRVARAFGLNNLIELGHATEIPGDKPGGSVAVILPHPSGRNRIWSSAEAVATVRTRIYGFLSSGEPVGEQPTGPTV